MAKPGLPALARTDQDPPGAPERSLTKNRSKSRSNHMNGYFTLATENSQTADNRFLCLTAKRASGRAAVPHGCQYVDSGFARYAIRICGVSTRRPALVSDSTPATTIPEVSSVRSIG